MTPALANGSVFWRLSTFTVIEPIPESVEGQTLVPIVNDTSQPGREYVVSALPFTNRDDMVGFVNDWNTRMDVDSTTTVTTDEWSLIYATQPGMSELYHLPSDPKQTRNVISERPEIAQELHKLLVGFMKETNLATPLFNRRMELRL